MAISPKQLIPEDQATINRLIDNIKEGDTFSLVGSYGVEAADMDWTHDIALSRDNYGVKVRVKIRQLRPLTMEVVEVFWQASLSTPEYMNRSFPYNF